MFSIGLGYALGGANAESWKVEGSAGGIVTDKAGNRHENIAGRVGQRKSGENAIAGDYSAKGSRIGRNPVGEWRLSAQGWDVFHLLASLFYDLANHVREI